MVVLPIDGMTTGTSMATESRGARTKGALTGTGGTPADTTESAEGAVTGAVTVAVTAATTGATIGASLLFLSSLAEAGGGDERLSSVTVATVAVLLRAL